MIHFIGEHMPTPLTSADPPPSPIQASLLCLDLPCLTALDSVLHSRLIPDDPLFSPPSLNSIHSPTYGLSIQPNLPTSRYRAEVAAFRTRHSISLCCLYYWTSLSPRIDKKKVHDSLLVMPRLNFTSLRCRPATPTILTSTPQASIQKTSTQSGGYNLAKAKSTSS